MSKQKTVLDFFTRSPAIKSPSGEAATSSVVDEKTPTSSKLPSNGNVSGKTAKTLSKSPAVNSPSNGTLAKSKISSCRSATPKSTKRQSNVNVLAQKGKRSKNSGELTSLIVGSYQRSVNFCFSRAHVTFSCLFFT
ncbi:hypothetical protein AVEN_2814-1 [Araneus ventricosus]|uniref:Uncharacterized protein n=1 Tax=Araneus ventricosus TaxID=182803 RepID=A0A4Y2VU57_ARAVE|nr:hypothetical protein AVEN_2814-1 [Araneus ventricosus]